LKGQLKSSNTKKMIGRQMLIMLVFISMAHCSYGQEDSLALTQAIEYTLENNFQIRITQNISDIAEKNTTVFNTGQLPSVFMDGSANYSLDNTNANFQDGRTAKVRTAPSQAVRLSMNVSYTIFNGYLRKYTIDQLTKQYQLTELQLKATMEKLVAQTLSQYYRLAASQNTLMIMEDMISLSQKRMERAQQMFEFGQGSGLNVLNAEVDLNNDSLNYINARLQFENTRRQLNNTMAVDADSAYIVSSVTDMEELFDRETLYRAMMENNTNLTLVDKDIQLGKLQINLAEARRLPSFDITGTYDISYNRNNPAAFLASQSSNGLFIGFTARWNVFDGGNTKTDIENARLNSLGLEMQKEQVIQNLQFDFSNAWAQYESAHFVLKTARKNLEINQKNYARSEEQYRIGQINSIDYRQAQLNLSNARVELNNAYFQLKIAEVQLLLLSGNLLNLV